MSKENGAQYIYQGGDQAFTGWDVPFKITGIPSGDPMLQMHHDSDQIGQPAPLPPEVFKKHCNLPPEEREQAFYLGPERTVVHKGELHGPQWFAFTDIMPLLTTSGMSPQSAAEAYSGLLIETGQNAKDLDTFLTKIATLTNTKKEDLWLRLTAGNWIGGGPMSETTKAIQTVQWKDMSIERSKKWKTGQSFYTADIVPPWVSNMQASIVENGSEVSHINKGVAQQVMYGLWHTLSDCLSGDQLRQAQKRFAQMFGRKSVEQTMNELDITPDSSASEVINAFMRKGFSIYPDIYSEANIAFTNTTNEFKVDAEGNSTISEYFNLWVRSYNSISGSYNRALERSGSGMSYINTDKGEMPFFVIDLNTGLKEKVHMISGSLQIGDSKRTYPLRPFEQIQQMLHGDQLAVVPATLPLAHVLDGKAQLVLPEEGSHYSEPGKEYETWMNELNIIEPQEVSLPALNQAGIKPHPILRVNPRALERIPSEVTLRLPQWIHRSIHLADPTVQDESVSGNTIKARYQEWQTKLAKIGDALDVGVDNFLELIDKGELKEEDLTPWIHEWEQKSGLKFEGKWLESSKEVWMQLRERRLQLKKIERTLETAQTLGTELDTYINTKVSASMKLVSALNPGIQLRPINSKDILYAQEQFIQFFSQTQLPIKEFDTSFITKCMSVMDFPDNPALQKMKGILLNSATYESSDFERIFGFSKSEPNARNRAVELFFQNTDVLTELHRLVSLQFADQMVEEGIQANIVSHLEKSAAAGQTIPENLVIDKRFNKNQKWDDLADADRNVFIGGIVRSVMKQIQKNKGLRQISQLSHLDETEINALSLIIENRGSNISPQKAVLLKGEIQELEDKFALQVLYPLATIKRDTQATAEALRYFNHRPWALLIHMISPDWFRNVAQNVDTHEQHMRVSEGLIQDIDFNGNKLVMMEDKAGIFSETNHPQKEYTEKLLIKEAISSGSDTAIVLTHPNNKDCQAKMLIIEKNGDHSNFCGNAASATGVLYKDWMEENGGKVVVENVKGDHVSIELFPSGEMVVSLPMVSMDNSEAAEIVRQASEQLGLDFKGIYTAASEPHAIINCKEFIGNPEELKQFALQLQSTVYGGINVNFIMNQEEESVVARVFERGVNDWTGSCGTGASSIGYAYGIQDGIVTFIKDNEKHITSVRRGGETQMQLVTKKAEMRINDKKIIDLTEKDANDLEE